MKGEKKINHFVAIVCAIIAIIIFCAIAVIFNVMPLNSLPVSFLGATLGALIGALITLVLLRGQTDIEEKKGKDIRILERKTEVFHDFIKNVWAVWSDQKITIEIFQELTSKYYQDLMIYIKKKDRLEKIGTCLSEMGKCIDKPEAVDNLRNQIVNIINELSEELELGGKVDIKIMDEHDRILFPLKFKNSILEALNTKLPDNNLEKGKFEFFREGKYNPEYVIFNFINYTGCKMILGPFDGTKIKFALVIDRKYHQVNDFRCKNPYNQRIDTGSDDVISGSPINFSDERNMETFRENRDTANTLVNKLADEASNYFEEMKINELSIPEFIEKHIKE